MSSIDINKDINSISMKYFRIKRTLILMENLILRDVIRGLSQKVVDFSYNKKTIRSIATKFYL